MANFGNEDRPAELGGVAKNHGANRHETTPLVLNQGKQRIISRASAKQGRKFRWLHRSGFITTTVVALAVGGGSAAAFGVHHKPHKGQVATIHHAAKAAPAAVARATVAAAALGAPSVASHVATPALGGPGGPFGFLVDLFGGGGGPGSGGFGGIATHIQYFIDQLEQAIFEFLRGLLGVF